MITTVCLFTLKYLHLPKPLLHSMNKAKENVNGAYDLKSTSPEVQILLRPNNSSHVFIQSILGAFNLKPDGWLEN